MKIVRIFCLLLVSLMAVSPVGTVLLAQDEEETPTPVLISEEEPQYALALTPYGERYDTIIISGRDSIVRVDVENQGDEAIHKVTFAADAPENWTVEFDPVGVATLDVFESESINAKIKVPAGTPAGDYMVTLKASGTEVSAKDIDIRVTVKIITTTEEAIAMSVAHPTLEAIAGGEFEFAVEFRYTAIGGVTGESRSFDLRAKGPAGWDIYITPRYEKEKRISAISLKPGFAYGEPQRVVATPPFWPLPEPGEYKLTLEAVSGEMTDTIELTAVITARYNLIVVPSAERYDTKAAAGKDNYFSIEVGNLGTAPIENINFSSDKPTGWSIEFVPDKVDLLEAFSTKTVDVNIKPPPETIAGDYVIKLRASGTQATSIELPLRITVETPTIWGWVGVAIIVLVIVGLVVIFMRFSRR